MVSHTHFTHVQFEFYYFTDSQSLTHPDGMMVDHDRRYSLQQHLHCVVVQIRHDRLSQLLQHDGGQVSAVLARHVGPHQGLHRCVHKHNIVTSRRPDMIFSHRNL